jgi:hypothetical protein
VAKTNYHQARRQKETARKARQQEKLAKKLARSTTPEPDAAQPTGDGAVESNAVTTANDVPAADAKVQP